MPRILIILFLTLGLIGCNSEVPLGSGRNEVMTERNYTKKMDNTKPEDSLKSLINNKVKEKFNNSLNMKITEVIHEDSNTFVKLKFETNDSKEYEGVVYALQLEKGWMLNEFDFSLVQKNIPFTHHELIAPLNDGSNREFRLISGVLNNSAITEIRIKYNNGPLAIIKIGKDQNTYLNYVIDNDRILEEITGLNEKREVIYSYMW